MNSEVLCCCHNVTMEDVEKQIEQGVRSFEKLQDETNIGIDCPPCKEKNEKLFYDLIKNKQTD